MAVAEFLKPPPCGILQLTVLSARALPRRDSSMFHAGANLGSSSDLVVKVKLGAKTLSTKGVKKSSSPAWNETFEKSLVFDDKIEELTLTIFSGDVVQGVCVLPLKVFASLVQMNQDHEINIIVPEQPQSATAEAKATPAPTLLVKTSFWRASAQEAEAGLVVVPELGVVSVRNLSVYGIASLVGERIYVKISCVNDTAETIVKKNPSPPNSSTWMESFNFVCHNPSSAVVRVTIMHEPRSIAGALGSLASGEMSQKHVQLGTVQVPLLDLTNSPGTLECKGMSFLSEKAQGEVSFDLAFSSARTRDSEL